MTEKPVKKLRIKKSKSVEEDYVKQAIQEEILLDDFKKTLFSVAETEILSHLGDYIEEPYHIIESYFQGQHLERLVRHQIESYNHFVNYQLPRTIQMFNPVTIHSDNDYVPEKNKYLLEIFISIFLILLSLKNSGE